jgi:hypothetical protein
LLDLRHNNSSSVPEAWTSLFFIHYFKGISTGYLSDKPEHFIGNGRGVY